MLPIITAIVTFNVKNNSKNNFCCCLLMLNGTTDPKNFSQKFQCQLALEDDLQSKSITKEIVCRNNFNSRNDYSCEY